MLLKEYLILKPSNEGSKCYSVVQKTLALEKPVSRGVPLLKYLKELDILTFYLSLFLTNLTVIHYLKNKVGVVEFANAQGLVMF